MARSKKPDIESVVFFLGLRFGDFLTILDGMPDKVIAYYVKLWAEWSEDFDDTRVDPDVWKGVGTSAEFIEMLRKVGRKDLEVVKDFLRYLQEDAKAIDFRKSDFFKNRFGTHQKKPKKAAKKGVEVDTGSEAEPKTEAQLRDEALAFSSLRPTNLERVRSDSITELTGGNKKPRQLHWVKADNSEYPKTLCLGNEPLIYARIQHTTSTYQEQVLLHGPADERGCFPAFGDDEQAFEVHYSQILHLDLDNCTEEIAHLLRQNNERYYSVSSVEALVAFMEKNGAYVSVPHCELVLVGGPVIHIVDEPMIDQLEGHKAIRSRLIWEKGHEPVLVWAHINDEKTAALEVKIQYIGKNSMHAFNAKHG